MIVEIFLKRRPLILSRLFTYSEHSQYPLDKLLLGNIIAIPTKSIAFMFRKYRTWTRYEFQLDLAREVRVEK